MIKKTHIIGGLATAAVVGAVDPISLICAGFGALLPDIDHSGSTLGKKVKPISKLLTHRGFCHSLIFVVIITFVTFVITRNTKMSGLNMIPIGMLTHLFLDMLNPSGIQLLYPIKEKIKVPGMRIKTGGFLELSIFIILLVFFVAISFDRDFTIAFINNIFGWFGILINQIKDAFVLISTGK